MRTLRQLAAKHLQMFHSQFGNAINLLADFHWRLHHAFQPSAPLPAGTAILHDTVVAFANAQVMAVSTGILQPSLWTELKQRG